ncbi:MAG: amino acid ABC transporter permease [Candidatus Nanopelagicales bacterium]
MNALLQNFFDLGQMAQTVGPLVSYGIRNTLFLAVMSSLFGVLIGMVLALLGLSRRWWLRVPARVYTDIFRGLPAAVVILLIGQGLYSLGVPGLSGSPYPLGIAAMSLMSAAYIGEIFRSGIQSVEKGQGEASRALGLSHSQAMRLVVVPQGVRRVLPALVNQFIGIIKDSSLIYFLGLIMTEREIFRIGQEQAVATGNLSPLVASGIAYLILTVPLTHYVNHIDKRLRDGAQVVAVAENAADSIQEGTRA